MKTIIVSMAILFGGSSCSMVSKFRGGDSDAPEVKPVGSSSTATTREPVRLSDADSHFIHWSSKLVENCPLRDELPPKNRTAERCDVSRKKLLKDYNNVRHPNHPKIVAGKAHLDELPPFIETWYQKEKSIADANATAAANAEALRSRRDRYLSVTSEYHNALAALHFGKHPKKISAGFGDDVYKRLKWYREGFAALADVVPAVCKDPQSIGSLSEFELKWTQPVDVACELVKNRDKYYRVFLNKKYKFTVDKYGMVADAFAKRIEKGKPVTAYDFDNRMSEKYFVKKYGYDIRELAKAFNKTGANKLLKAAWRRAYGRMTAAIKTQSGLNVWKRVAKKRAKHSDRHVVRAVRDIPNAKIIRVKSTDRNWEVIRQYGKPKFRRKGGMALVQKKGESFCRLYRFGYKQDHLGGGRYGKAYMGPGADFYISGCK